MYSSAITMLERNKKTLGQNREKRDKCGKTAAAANERGGCGCGECGVACVAGENEKLVDF